MTAAPPLRRVAAAQVHPGREGIATAAARTKVQALQKGIYFGPGETPPNFFSFVLLRATQNDAKSVGTLLGKLWARYAELKQGIVHDLGREHRVPSGNLEVLLGFGANAFAPHLAGAAAVPQALGEFDFAPPVPTAPIAKRNAVGELDSGIAYAPELPKASFVTDFHFALQFTADTALAAERAVVETWKLLYDEKPAPAALAIAAVFTGTQRDDHRSWLDFHDGLSNLRAKQREAVIAIGPDAAPAGEEWTVNGTYLAFVRLGIDLQTWRKCDIAGQQRLVGRNKLNGCPLPSFENAYGGRDAPGCPVAGMRITNKRNKFRDPPSLPEGRQAGLTHMHRANQRHRELPFTDPHSFRIYRQGYPFLEPNPQAPTDFEKEAGFRAGLNFVSFQNTPMRLIGMLTSEGWLGGTNYGGSDANMGEPMEVTILRAYAAGMFFVPPVEKPFPGARALGV